MLTYPMKPGLWPMGVKWDCWWWQWIKGLKNTVSGVFPWKIQVEFVYIINVQAAPSEWVGENFGNGAVSCRIAN